jgi:hypothetical protein
LRGKDTEVYDSCASSKQRRDDESRSAQGRDRENGFAPGQTTTSSGPNVTQPAHSQSAVLVSGDSDLLDLADSAPIFSPADFPRD